MITLLKFGNIIKTNQSDLTTNISTLNSSIGLKSNTSDINASLGLKATQSDLTTNINALRNYNYRVKGKYIRC